MPSVTSTSSIVTHSCMLASRFMRCAHAAELSVDEHSATPPRQEKFAIQSHYFVIYLSCQAK